MNRLWIEGRRVHSEPSRCRYWQGDIRDVGVGIRSTGYTQVRLESWPVPLKEFYPGGTKVVRKNKFNTPIKKSKDSEVCEDYSTNKGTLEKSQEQFKHSRLSEFEIPFPFIAEHLCTNFVYLCLPSSVQAPQKLPEITGLNLFSICEESDMLSLANSITRPVALYSICATQTSSLFSASPNQAIQPNAQSYPSTTNFSLS